MEAKDVIARVEVLDGLTQVTRDGQPVEVIVLRQALFEGFWKPDEGT